MDNPSESTGALNLDSAAAAISDFFEPKKEPAQADKPGEDLEASPEVTAEAERQDADATAETTEDDPLVTIKVDGKEIEVPLSELKSGYQRQADYTRKTMEVAEQRKAAEAEAAKVQQERQDLARGLQRTQAALEAALMEQQRIDWDQLIQNDPQEYLRQKHLFDQRQAAWQQNIAEQNQLAEKIQAEEQIRHRDHLKAQQEQLLAKLPEWSDPKKAQAESAEIRSYLLEQGFSQQLVDTLADANMVLTARKAMLFDRMVAKAQATQKKVATLPQKVEKPGTGAAPTLDRRTAAFQKLSKTGRVEDAAHLFSQFV